MKKNQAQTNHDYALEAIRNEILNGEFFPGAWLRERDLVEQLQVSRTPIREALKQLEADGLIEIVPYRGAKVKAIDPDKVIDEYVIRAALEGLAAELAVINITDADIEELEALETHMDQLLLEHDFPNYFKVNRDFHYKIYSLAGSAGLIELITSSWERVNLYRRFFLNLREGVSLEIANHKSLIAACRERDADLAHKIVKDSCLQTANLIAEQVQQANADGKSNVARRLGHSASLD